MKVIVDYEPTTGQITSENGLTVFLSGGVFTRYVPTDEIIKLKAAGFNAQDIKMFLDVGTVGGNTNEV